MKVLVMAPQGNRHLDEQELEDYSMGRVCEEEASRLAQHLSTCESCRLQLSETKAYVWSMRRAGARLQEEQQRGWRSWMYPRFAPILAATLAVLALGLSLRFSKPAAVTPVAVMLATTRGAAAEPQAPPGRPLLLQPDLEGLPALPSYPLEMVDRNGRRVWQGVLHPSASGTSVAVPAARTGLYFVRVSTPSGTLLREYPLQIGAPR